MKGIIKAAVASLCVAGAVAAFAENLFPGTEMDAKSGWMIWVNKPVLDAGGSGNLEDGNIVVKSPSYDKQNAYNIQIMGKVDVPADKTYVLKLKIKSDKEGKVYVNYSKQGAPYTSYAGGVIMVQPGEKEYTCKLAVKKDKDGNYDGPRVVRIVPGDLKDAELTFFDVSLEEEK
jgi:hypothetical protein